MVGMATAPPVDNTQIAAMTSISASQTRFNRRQSKHHISSFGSFRSAEVGGSFIEKGPFRQTKNRGREMRFLHC